MKIFPHNHKHHPKIEIDTIVGELAGRGAIQLKDMKEIYKDRIRDFAEQVKTSESILL